MAHKPMIRLDYIRQRPRLRVQALPRHDTPELAITVNQEPWSTLYELMVLVDNQTGWELLDMLARTLQGEQPGTFQEWLQRFQQPQKGKEG